MIYSQFLSLSSNTTGTTWNAWPSAGPINQLHVLNATGTTLSFRMLGSSGEFQLPTAYAWTFTGINNAAQLEMRRTDTSNTPITAFGTAEFDKNS